MVSRVLSCTVKGLEAVPVHVELDMTGGLPGLTIVGMGDTAIREGDVLVIIGNGVARASKFHGFMKTA